MTRIVFYFSFFISTFIFCQKNYTKELSLKTDNDLYASIKRDRYYTSGVFLSYRYLNKKKTTVALKKIYEIQLGQELYTPQRGNVVFKFEHDRPYAGYLFGSFGFANFYQNNSIFKVSSQIGVIGKNAFGEETIDFIHRIYGFDEAVGWKYQIADAFTFNIHGSYTKNIKNLSSKYIATDWISTANTGLIFNNISTALNLRIGFNPLKSINNSMAYNGNLGTQQTTKEFFLHIKPKLQANFHDATIEGSILNNSSPITYDVKPIVLSSEFGVSYAVNNINLNYSLLIHSRKLDNPDVPASNKYGSIQINYLF